MAARWLSYYETIPAGANVVAIWGSEAPIGSKDVLIDAAAEFGEPYTIDEYGLPNVGVSVAAPVLCAAIAKRLSQAAGGAVPAMAMFPPETADAIDKIKWLQDSEDERQEYVDKPSLIMPTQTIPAGAKIMVAFSPKQTLPALSKLQEIGAQFGESHAMSLPAFPAVLIDVEVETGAASIAQAFWNEDGHVYPAIYTVPAGLEDEADLLAFFNEASGRAKEAAKDVTEGALQTFELAAGVAKASSSLPIIIGAAVLGAIVIGIGAAWYFTKGAGGKGKAS